MAYRTLKVLIDVTELQVQVTDVPGFLGTIKYIAGVRQATHKGDAVNVAIGLAYDAVKVAERIRRIYPTAKIVQAVDPASST